MSDVRALPREMLPGEVTSGAVSMVGRLPDGAVLTGSPTCTVTLKGGGGSSGVSVGTLAKNSGAITVDGVSVAANKAITCIIDASSANAAVGQEYELLFTCSHDGVTGGVLKLRCPLKIR